FDETLKELMKMEYLHSDGDVFVDYSWERALSIEGDVYPEWCLEFFSMMYLKCVWFRLCGREHVLTLSRFAVLLGLYKESELEHHLFGVHFSKLEIDDKLFDHDTYWRKVRKPTRTNRRTSLIWEPLMRVMHRLIVGALVHRLGSKDRCQKMDLWMMSALEESLRSCWGYLVNKEVGKCSEPIECEKWTTKMLASELDLDNHTLLGSTLLPPPPRVAREQRQEPSGLNSSWGDWNASLNEIERRDVWRDSMQMRNNYMLEHCMPILHHLANQANFAYHAYEP
ncbi:hypothetical protein Tco_1472377, partial [Tanacetum coccineum]